MGVHVGTTWPIQLNRPCAAAMRPFDQITLTTCQNFIGEFANFKNLPRKFVSSHELRTTQQKPGCSILVDSVENAEERGTDAADVGRVIDHRQALQRADAQRQLMNPR